MAETTELKIYDSPLADLQTQLDHFKSAYDELHAEHTELQAKYSKLVDDYAAALAKLPPSPPEYQYAEDECRPVTAIKGETCGMCGWMYGGKRKQDREPHPVRR